MHFFTNSMKIFRLLAAALVGASLGLLFAPKKGEELRKSIKNSDRKFAEFADALAKASQSASGEVKKVINSPEVQDTLNQGKEHFDSLLGYLQTKSSELSGKAKTELEQIVDKAGEKAKKASSTAKKGVKKGAKGAKKTVKKGAKSIKTTAKKTASKAKEQIS
jgi:gas vesicle protein